ncbi:MAG: hypothetical protein ACREUS_09280 [Burkholderiales bacterium]
MSDLSQIKSMRGRVSNEEWQTRVDLAAFLEESRWPMAEAVWHQTEEQASRHLRK